MLDECLLNRMFSIYLQESLAARGWSLEDLKQSCSLSRKKLSRLTQGQAHFFPEIVQELQLALDWESERIDRIYQLSGIAYLTQLKADLEEWDDLSSSQL